MATKGSGAKPKTEAKKVEAKKAAPAPSKKEVTAKQIKVPRGTARALRRSGMKKGGI